MIRKCDIPIQTESGVPVMQKPEQPFVFIPQETMKMEDGKNTFVNSLIVTNLGTRKRKIRDTPEDEFWSINWPRINQHLRNELIFNLIRNHRDYKDTDEKLWRSFFFIADTSGTLGQQQSDPLSVNFGSSYLL